MHRRRLLPHSDIPDALLVPLTRGYVAIVDADVASEVGRWNWSAFVPRDGKRVYAARAIRLSPERTTKEFLHRFLWSLWGNGPALQIDHRNLDGLDNRRSNLRAATAAQNGGNKGLQVNNASGRKGVTWNSAAGKWQAQIRHAGKRTYLGLFATADEAGSAYDAAARLWHGEFARSK